MGVAKKVVRDWTETRGNAEIPQVDLNMQGHSYRCSLLRKERSIKFEHNPAMISGRTTHMTLPSKRTPFQTAQGVKGA
jgi:hypothetical protein